MGENTVLEKSFHFAVRMVALNKYLVQEKLVREAQHAESNPDFVHKMSIALKEANETDYWLSLLHETAYLTKDQYASLQADIQTLLKLLITIIKTAKKKNPK